ncbi:SWF or SNF family helicase [uncultured Streptomyces sp.]|uniref:SWF or SNF family helicase n=1 Tax=uncultured Streptomyces sp. TaxID=174707 RepID=UPI002605E6C9|nr:SWF or SNF family helicase [uncultured Streptomyces sp.]
MSGANERIFAAPAPAPGRSFAVSWWGRAWLKALEDTALDGQQLKKGRRLAREGRVGAVSVRPGRITAVVRDPDGSAYRSDVLLQTLDEEGWDRFLRMAAARAGHIAALLEREMPPHLVEDAAEAGVNLLPGIGDMEPECGCEAWDHCPHSAALCYQVARLLDRDPFVLLLLRGRGERDLLDELQSRSEALAVEESAGADRRGPARPVGVPAEEVFAAASALPALPAPPPLPPEPGQARSLLTEPGPAPGLDPAALEALASDAAARAHRMLAEALAPAHARQPVPAALTERQDAVRLASSAHTTQAIVARLAAGTARTRSELDTALRAWRYGGAGALAALEEEWDLDPEAAVRARAALDAAWEAEERPRFRNVRNRWTVRGRDAQLRLGRDGRWWPYARERGRWVPAGPAAADPAGALEGARAEE